MATMYLLFVACVAAVFAGAVAKPGQCSRIHLGDIHSSIPHPLLPAQLGPGIRDWQVKIPDNQSCPLELVHGVEVIACDFDFPPVAKFESKFVFDVHRTGNLLMPGEVEVILYCSNFGGLASAMKSN